MIELLISHKANINLRTKVTRGVGWDVVAPMVVGADTCILGACCYRYGVVVWISEFG